VGRPESASPATPIIVNGVVFTLATSRAASGGAPAVLRVRRDVRKELWTSASAMKRRVVWQLLSAMVDLCRHHRRDIYTFGFLDEDAGRSLVLEAHQRCGDRRSS
jgi:hypothetical protein